MYIIEPKERSSRAPNLRKRDTIRQVMVGQFPLSFNLDTGVFALGGSRLTAEQWINLRGEVDSFLEKHGLLDRFEVHNFRPSLSKRVVRWLTRR